MVHPHEEGDAVGDEEGDGDWWGGWACGLDKVLGAICDVVCGVFFEGGDGRRDYCAWRVLKGC